MCCCAGAVVVTPCCCDALLLRRQCGVLKVDVDDPANSQIWLPPPHQFCGESIFTPRRPEKIAEEFAEDDGYVLTLCFDGQSGTSELLVLDARHVDGGPIARVPLSDVGAALPADAQIHGPGHGLHGTFVPDLCPSIDDVVRAEERARASLSARFLTDEEPL